MMQKTTKFSYRKQLKNNYLLVNSQPGHVEGLARLQREVFPLLSEDEILKAHHYLKHIEVFPEGQFAVLNGDEVIGSTTTVRTRYMAEPHTFLEASGNLVLSNYDPEGEWLYGLDIGVSSRYRGYGLGKALYRARQELVRHLGLKGQITVGLINGYHKMQESMSPEEYVDQLKKGTLNDPTVSYQQGIGFAIKGLIHNYCSDPTCGNCGVVLMMDATHVI
ncbi:MAG: GNAT family N-acetyltransferase [Sinomicrobium sp.]|nr:GNAT family N-acetyltransferase [Sinomicrobium sp.]